MNLIISRLTRLEERANGAGGPCPECGDSPPRPELIVLYADDTPEEPRFSSAKPGEIPEGEQFCPECGRQQWIIITMVYDG